MALWQLVHSPCLCSVCPLCLECCLPIFPCPNDLCLLRHTAQCHFPQEAFPDPRNEYYFRAHLHPVQPSGKVPTTLHRNDGGSIGRDQLYILRITHQFSLYSSGRLTGILGRTVWEGSRLTGLRAIFSKLI